MAEPGDAGPGVKMREDVEDLKVQVLRLTEQVSALMRQRAEDSAQDQGDASEGPGEPRFPPLIFLLDSPAYDIELRALTEWVEGVLVPGYLSEPASEARWCHLWTEHPPAVARLHALWLAWQELTNPATCGYTGPSVWHRDHLRPCVDELRGPRGPFEGCTKGEHRVVHRLPGLVPSAWYRSGEAAELEDADR